MPEILVIAGGLFLLIVLFAGLAYRRYATRSLPDADEYYQQGLIHLEEWSYIEAEEAFAQAIRRNPDYAAAYAGRGKAAERRGFYRAAIQDYTRALERDPQLLPVYLDRAHVYSKMEHWAVAIADYTAILAHAGSDLITKVQAYAARSKCYEALGNLAQAKADLDAACELDPEFQLSYLLRVEAYRQGRNPGPLPARIRADFAGDPDAVVAAYSRAIAAHPTAAGAYAERGVAYLWKGRPDEAQADFNTAVNLSPATAWLYLERARLFAESFNPNQNDQALADYDRSIALDPANADAYYRRGLLYMWKAGFVKRDETATWEGYFRQALVDYDHAIELNPANPRYYRAKAEVFEKQGEIPAALEQLNQAVALDPNDGKNYYSRAAIYRTLGQPAEARRDYDQALALHPPESVAKEIHRILELLDHP